MPASPRETVRCRYQYDPLDRQVGCTLFEQSGIQLFYCKSRLATEIQGAMQCSIFQHDDQLLAQQQSQSGKLDTTLLATDQQRSILNALDATRPHPLAYTPYGHRPQGNGLLSLLGFNGERLDPVTGHYHLGNGYRQFNPVLMRFNSPDSWSPFGEGGLNAYAYCGGDPINRADPNGHSPPKLAMSVWDDIFGNINLIKGEDLALTRVQVKTAIDNTITTLGGVKNINKVAVTTDRHAYAIIVSALPELRPIKPMTNYRLGEDISKYLRERPVELQQLIETRNISSAVLSPQGEYFKHLNKSEIANLQRLNQQAQTELDDRLEHFRTFFEPAQPPPSASSTVTNIRKR